VESFWQVSRFRDLVLNSAANAGSAGTAAPESAIAAATAATAAPAGAKAAPAERPAQAAAGRRRHWLGRHGFGDQLGA